MTKLRLKPDTYNRNQIRPHNKNKTKRLNKKINTKYTLGHIVDISTKHIHSEIEVKKEGRISKQKKNKTENAERKTQKR